MTSERSDSKVFAASAVTLILLGVVCVVSVPFLAGLVLTAVLPEVGALRDEGGAWKLLHMLWIYPVFFVVAGILEPLTKTLALSVWRPAVVVLEVGLLWALLTWMFTVYFEHPVGAGIAAAVGIALLVPFTRLLERTGKDGEED